MNNKNSYRASVPIWAKRLILVLSMVSLGVCRTQAQGVAVAPLTLPRTQFLSSTGVPVAGGCVNFFATGTSTPQAIYADSGGVNQLANPLTLDAAGEASVWMSNTGYDIVLNAGVFGTACSVSLGSQLWRENNKNPFSIINSGSNYIVASGTSDPAGSAGELAYRTDIPCFRGFTSLWDCFTQNAAVQTLSNKTLTAPVINGGTQNSPAVLTPSINGVTVANSPGTYISVGNSPIGTVVSRLTKLVGGLAQTSLTTDVNGSIGITTQCISSCGQPGSSFIQQSGTATCFFDNATTAGDYVQISVLTGGSCHDTGSATLPSTGQVIGRALVTNVSSATPLSLDLYGPEVIAGNVGAAAGCTAIGPVTIAGLNTQQNLLSCTIPANTLSAGSELSVDIQGIESTAVAQTITLGFSLGGATACTAISGTTGVANFQPWNLTAKLFLLTAGAGGTANWGCGGSTTTSGGGLYETFGAVGAPTIAVNTTIVNTLQITVQMSGVNAGNSVSQQGLKAVIY